ncbi:MAG: MSCRAMM family protein [Gemmatimonadales bacterium]
MHRFPLLIACAGLALPGAVPAVARAQDDLGRLSGVVRDDGAFPIEDVGVRILTGWSTQTDPTGRFRFDGLRPGEYRVRFDGFGYVVAETTLVVRAGEQTDVNLRLSPTVLATRPVEVRAPHGGISGGVFDVQLRPLAGAAVEVLGTRQQATTDSSGGFSLGELRPGTYMVGLRRSGYGPALRAVVVRESDSRELYVPLVPLPGGLSGDRGAEASGLQGFWATALWDFSSRQVRHDRRAVLVAREELWGLGSTTLDLALERAPSAVAQRYRRTELRTFLVYLEGRPSGRSLTTIKVNDIEAVELYPAPEGGRGQVWIWIR